jgi:hypothetical protein
VFASFAKRSRYYRLSDPQLSEFVDQFKIQRRKLYNALPGINPGLEALFRGEVNGLQLKSLSIDEILKQPIDSDMLLGSLKIVS